MESIRNERDRILCDEPGAAQDVEVVGRVRRTNHNIERSRIGLDLRRVRNAREVISELTVKREVEEFMIMLQKI